MTSPWSLAPGRPDGGCPGALSRAGLALLLVVAGCGRGPERSERLPLGRDTVDLAPGVSVAEVRLGGPDLASQVQPGSLAVRAGDVVRFVTADARPHAVAFESSALVPAARSFLERTGQLRGPPLVSLGASWVVSLKGAPPGRYPFTCLTDTCRGVLVVSSAGER